VLVENRPGATGMVGAAVVAKSAPDGYTLVNVISSHVVHPSLVLKVPFDPIADFTPIVMLMRSPNLFCVNLAFPAKSVAELVANARANPGKLSFGATGVGGSNHLTGELFKIAAQVDIQAVPYKGAAPAIADAIGGQIPIVISTIASVGPMVKGGRLRALAVSSARRDPSFPDIPTLAESGYPGFDASEWWAILGPAGMPPEVVAKLNAEIDRIMKLPDVKARSGELGIEYIGGTPEEARAFMKSEMDKWSKVVRSAGLKPE
jgi:tripartite-type tricarboxylate transporter receptor subunit TctC